ncbi:MAG: MBL fold metallo-hydrolase [Chthoniobacter sp.]|uniref:MBL fold metallo-hydrolase n=1 Tax=Chthoniobacter sp. TaxID=2510640 RepID=UPI0032A745B3
MMVQDSQREVLAAPHHPQPSTWRDDRVTAAWLGHATVLINFFGVNILTDPVLFDRCGIRVPPFTIGPKRYVACALQPRELPRIDLVLLSHAHFDHLDLRSLRAISREAVVVTARRTADIFRRIRFREVIELDWEESREIETARGGVTVAAFQLLHWGARLQYDDYRGYNSYVFERGSKRLCHVGDSARTPAQRLGSRGQIDLLCAPIGAYQPWIHAHCTPEEAVAMTDEARARFVLPMHHQTFKLSWEPMEEPIQRFTTALRNAPQRVALTEIGQTFELPP